MFIPWWKTLINLNKNVKNLVKMFLIDFKYQNEINYTHTA